VVMATAITYDYGYDQVTNTGPYSSLPPRDLPPWSSLTTNQKIERVAYVGVAVLIVIPIIITLAPK
jgi:hypothetical protein